MFQVVAAILICAAPTSRPVKYLEYRDAHKAALKTGQPLVVLVSASWCPPCRRMKRELPVANRDGLLNRCLVAVVDVDKKPKLARLLMKGRSVPQTLFYWRYKGKWWQWRFVGYRSPKRIRAVLKTVLEQTDVGRKR